MFNFSGVGKVVREVSVKELGDTRLATFTVVSNRGVKKDENKWENIGTFIEVKAWGYTADIASKLVNQDVVQVVGSLEQETWLDKNTGEKRSKYVVNATTVKQIKFGKSEKTESEKTEDEKTEETVANQVGTDEVPF